MKRWNRRLPVALCLVLAGSALAACGTKTLEGREVADQVRAEVLTPRGIRDANVRCPNEFEAKEGATVRCTVTDDEKNKGTVTAKADSDGNLGDFKPNIKDVQVAVLEENAEKEASDRGVTGISCAAVDEPKKGAEYTCFGTVRGSGLTRVNVTQESEKGDVSVQVVRRALTTGRIRRQVERAAERQLGINVNVECPPRVRSRVGTTFTCKVTNPANGRSVNQTFRQTDEEGNVRLIR